MSTLTDPVRRPEVIAPGAGRHLHFLNHLATLKVRPDEVGALSVVEFTATLGFGPPLHRHEDEDELFVVLEGELAFTSGDHRLTAGVGGIAHLPSGIAHTFEVRSEQARFVCVTGSNAGAPRFDRMVEELGEPVDTPVLPTPDYVDATRVADVCRRHGIEVVGPPPGTA